MKKPTKFIKSLISETKSELGIKKLLKKLLMQNVTISFRKKYLYASLHGILEKSSVITEPLNEYEIYMKPEYGKWSKHTECILRFAFERVQSIKKFQSSKYRPSIYTINLK